MADKKQPTVLIIDDEKVIRDGFKRYLEDLEYRVLEAENGRVGLDIYEQKKPDLILLDLRMPEIGGLDVLARINELTPDMPVIIVSATGEIDNAIEALRQGAWDYLSKPVLDMQVLRHSVEKALERAILIRKNRAYQEHLEEEVSSRTKDLEKANEYLKKEINERKLAEDALRESETKYRELVQNAASIILRMDTGGNVTFFNEFAQNFFGYTEDEILGKNVVGTIVPEADSTGQDLAAMILEIGHNPENYSNNENENIRRNGQRVWVSWTNKAIEDENGRVLEILCVGNDITENKRMERQRSLAEQALKKREAELEEQTLNLEEANAALKVLLAHRDLDKKEFQEKILSNVKEMVFPYVEKLRTSQLNDRQLVYLDIVKSHLEDIIAPFLHRLSSKYSDLTPSEIKVAGFVKDGKTTKEIAELLNLSTGAVNFHRNNLRKKLGLRNKKTNLRSHLLSLT